jgi:hypothetical protein
MESLDNRFTSQVDFKSCNKTKVRTLDVIALIPSLPPRIMSIEFQLHVYILNFLMGRNDYE